MNENVLEKRLAALEQAVKDLQQWRNQSGPAGNWIDRLSGSVSDQETFRKAVEAGRAFRHADRPEEEGDGQ
jgi:hypothetical protein